MFYLLLDKLRKKNCSIALFHIFSFLFVVFPVFVVIGYSFTPVNSYSIKDNFAHINESNFLAILRSFWVSCMTIIFTFVIAYPFSWFVINIRSSSMRFFLIMMISVPLWSSFFVKLLGLKSLFDWINGHENSTMGLIYVIIGLVYLNLPIAILNFYDLLNGMPKNLINASLDLGNNVSESLYKVVMPYMKDSIISTIFLVFVSSFTTVTVADFLNNENGSKMIGQLFSSYSKNFSSSVDKSRISVLTLFLSLNVFGVYLLVKVLPIVVRKIMGFFGKND